jgi:glycosyltransferase involved in cell wall biosynthesis
MQRDADALLFLEFEAPGVEGILTGKLFEYLFVQTPIIAVGISKDSAAGQIIENSGRGRAYGKDIQKLADELLQMLKTGARSQREQPGELHLDIRQFSRAAQAERLLALVSSA